MTLLLDWLGRLGRSPWLPPFFVAWSTRGLFDEGPSFWEAGGVVVWALLWWLDVRDRRWDWEFKGDSGVLKAKGPLTQQQVEALRAAWADLNRSNVR